MDEFTIYFNRRKQWVNVKLWDVHPTTFANWGGGRWAYFEAKWENPRKGLFGELHFVKSRIREDTVAHEIFHVICEVVRSRDSIVTTRNEEHYAKLTDELFRKFYKGYETCL